MSPGQRDALEALARTSAGRHREVLRARALVMAADGVAKVQFAAAVGVTPVTVRAWRAPVRRGGAGPLRGGAGGPWP